LETENTTFQSGFVSIIGVPNVGKSTLLNALINQKIAIVSPKAQTTRRAIIGIHNAENHQIVFVDTPGIITPHYALQETMMQSVEQSLQDTDVIVWLTTDKINSNENIVVEKLQKISKPILVLINKSDKSDTEKIQHRISQLGDNLSFANSLAISALHKFNIESLISLILNYLPIHPAYYELEQFTDQTERQLITEIIREKILTHYQEEIPYSCEVTILEYKEVDNQVRIHTEIHVERDSQKIILIGKNGMKIKRIRIEARRDIEALLGKTVFLELYVRVAEGWKNKENFLKKFGYLTQ